MQFPVDYMVGEKGVDGEEEGDDGNGDDGSIEPLICFVSKGCGLERVEEHTDPSHTGSNTGYFLSNKNKRT